jgi:hypothetical protein
MIRKFRALDAGVEDAVSEGITRAPQKGHLEAVFSIGSTQRQHALVITIFPTAIPPSGLTKPSHNASVNYT